MARILIVDDEAVIRTLLVTLLKSKNHTAVSAESGAKALELIGGTDFDLIVSDLRMPDMSGLELLKLVKQRIPTVPVVLITAYFSHESVVEAVRFGVFDYIRKPFGMSDLLAVVGRALDADKAAVCAKDAYTGNNREIISYLAQKEA